MDLHQYRLKSREAGGAFLICRVCADATPVIHTGLVGIATDLQQGASLATIHHAERHLNGAPWLFPPSKSSTTTDQ